MSLILYSLCVLAQLNSIHAIAEGSGSFDKAVNGLLSSASEVHLAPAVVAGLCIGVGTVVTFYGYKLFRPVLFLCGFAVGAVLMYFAAEKIFSGKSYITTACWIAFFVGGAILGCLVMNVFSLGIFLVGAAAGVLLAFTVNTTFGYKIWPSNPDAMLIILIVVLGLLCGWLAMWLERPALIVCTSFFGAVAAVWGVGYFAGQYPSGADLKSLRDKLADGEWSYHIPHAWYGYLAATIVLFLLGMYVQFTNTASGVNHNRNAKASRRYQGTSTPRSGNPVAHV